MIECVCYIADDGTTFKDEDECRDYERSLELKKYERDIHMWDEHFQPIDVTDPTALDKVYYLTCDTAEAKAAMAEVMTDALIDYEYASHWDGVLPKYMGGDSTPIVDMRGE